MVMSAAITDSFAECVAGRRAVDAFTVLCAEGGVASARSTGKSASRCGTTVSVLEEAAEAVEAGAVAGLIGVTSFLDVVVSFQIAIEMIPVRGRRCLAAGAGGCCL